MLDDTCALIASSDTDVEGYGRLHDGEKGLGPFQCRLTKKECVGNWDRGDIFIYSDTMAQCCPLFTKDDETAKRTEDVYAKLSLK